ncbi:putative ribonuclease H-like domain-containing protein [Tanacetum coccineum]|uniref:Ribonuclease H-like domain-containing protein n=1 Tax=Tanacetum coccineum TaxID=301880 RepID=A0ABQ4ZNR3_9ASTR
MVQYISIIRYKWTNKGYCLLKTNEEFWLAQKEKKARILLMSIPEDHLAKFHKMTNAKDMWEAIKSIFGGNDESKKMHKYILKQQFESFSVSNSEGLHKGYDRFQSIMSQLEIHGAGVSTKDANQKFFRVFESDVKGSSASSSSIQNVAFVSSESNSVRRKLQFDAKEPVGFDKTKVECFKCHNTGYFAKECRSKGNQESRRRDAGNTEYKAKDNRRPGKQEEPKALVTIDVDGVDWTVNTARQNLSSQAAATSTARKVNTARPIETLKWKLNLLKDILYCYYSLLILQQSRAQKQRIEVKRLMWIMVQRQTRSQNIRKIKPFWRSLKGLKDKKMRLMMQLEELSDRPDLTNNDQDDSQIPALEEIFDNPSDEIFTNASYDEEGVVVDFTNLKTTMNVSPIPSSRIHSIHPTTQILGDPTSAVQTRSKVNKSSGAHAFVSYIQKQRRNNHKDFQHCLFACFFSQIEPQKISQALKDESWVDAMQEELLQFKIHKVWILIDLPFGKKAIGTKWVYRNKKDERGVVVTNKARLVAQGYRQEEGIDYDEVFSLVARIEAIRIFLAFASYMGFIVHQMDVKSALLYGIIDEESGYRRGTIDKTLFIKKDRNDIMLVQVYVDDIIFGSTKKSWCDEFEALMKSKFQIKILKKFNFDSVKTASTPIETQKPLIKDEEAADVDVHLYRSMIGSLMYLTASRPDIMYLKDKPKLGLWYPRVSSFDMEAYSDSDYAGANLDRKSTTGGCQFLGMRLILWQCKKQTIVATSTTEAEYVAAANCYGQVLWIQNQILDYGFNFINTKIYIDNESTICIVKNPVFHSKTKHIEIRHHFIRDAYEKKLIQVLKIHTNDNVADLLTKAFDVSRFNFLIVNIRMINL